MSLHENTATLEAALKNLRVQWEAARMEWRDAKALEFEDAYLRELPHLVARATNAIGEIDALLGKVHRDCD